jgi:hypothetical protein
MTKDAIITLSIKVAGTPPQSTYLFHVMVDGNVIASNQSLSPEESKAVREISRRYNALFEGGCAPKLAAEKLTALGAELFGLWMDPGRSLRQRSFLRSCNPFPSSGCRKPFFAADLGLPQNLHQEACSYHFAVMRVGDCQVKMVPHHVGMTRS